jgi:hypothetical protein
MGEGTSTTSPANKNVQPNTREINSVGLCFNLKGLRGSQLQHQSKDQKAAKLQLFGYFFFFVFYSLLIAHYEKKIDY